MDRVPDTQAPESPVGRKGNEVGDPPHCMHQDLGSFHGYQEATPKMESSKLLRCDPGKVEQNGISRDMDRGLLTTLRSGANRLKVIYEQIFRAAYIESSGFQSRE